MKTLIKVIKWLGVGTAFAAQFTPLLSGDYAAWGLIAVAAASALKDTLYKIADQIDNGKQDNSVEVG